MEKRIIGMDNPEKYKVLVLESYSPSVETKFTFDGKILAYYSPENKGCEISKDSDFLTITPKNENSIVAVAYRINQNDINWAILGPVIGIVTIFLILLSIKIIKSVKAPHKKRGY